MLKITIEENGQVVKEMAAARTATGLFGQCILQDVRGTYNVMQASLGKPESDNLTEADFIAEQFDFLYGIVDWTDIAQVSRALRVLSRGFIHGPILGVHFEDKILRIHVHSDYMIQNSQKHYWSVQPRETTGAYKYELSVFVDGVCYFTLCTEAELADYKVSDSIRLLDHTKEPI